MVEEEAEEVLSDTDEVAFELGDARDAGALAVVLPLLLLLSDEEARGTEDVVGAVADDDDDDSCGSLDGESGPAELVDELCVGAAGSGAPTRPARFTPLS